MNEQELTPRTLTDALEDIKHQEPLVTTYETSDFKQGLNRGAWLEQERIIKLLEEKYIELDCDHDGAWWCHAEDEISKLITLIKGENK